jgi:hypothetical protein
VRGWRAAVRTCTRTEARGAACMRALRGRAARRVPARPATKQQHMLSMLGVSMITDCDQYREELLHERARRPKDVGGLPRQALVAVAAGLPRLSS